MIKNEENVINYIEPDQIKENCGHISGGNKCIELATIRYANRLDDIKNSISDMFNKLNLKYSFYNNKTLNNIFNFLDKYFRTMYWNATHYHKLSGEYYIINGGILFDTNAFMIMQWEGDYGSCGGYIFCDNEEDGINFLKSRYTRTLGGDEFTLVCFENENIDINSYDCILTKKQHAILHGMTEEIIIEKYNLDNNFFEDKKVNIDTKLNERDTMDNFDISMKIVKF